jgi:hypothetical protein
LFRRILISVVLALPAAAQQPPTDPWHYGGFADGAYLKDFNDPANHLFRTRSTTFYLNAPVLNMAAGYLRKDATTESRWGMELALQAGKDSEQFGYSATAPNLPGSRWLRHLGLADVSYLVPAGSGLTVQAGIFNSLIGYDALYAKDNFTYTRPWGGDNTPYLMMGVNASYAFTQKLTATGCVINSYFHLSNPNNAPTFCGQAAYKPNGNVTLKETLLYGPQQADTALGYWRFFSDSIAERKAGRLTTALEYQVGTERVAAPGNPRALWMAALMPIHAVVHGPWSATLQPEVAWDRDGRWTGLRQTVKAVTATLEYRLAYRWSTTIARLEYRYDNSHGSGGFFQDGYGPGGIPLLVPGQHLLVMGLIVVLEKPAQAGP